MIKQNQRLFNFLNRILEIGIIFLSYLIATYIRFVVMYAMDETAPALQVPWNNSYFLVAFLYAVLLVSIYHFTGQFASSRSFFSFSNRTVRLAYVNAMGILLFAAFLYITRLADFSRIALVIFYFVSTGLILLKRAIVQRTLDDIRSKGYNLKHVVIVGNGKLAKQYAKAVKKNKKLGFHLVGYVSAVKREELGVCLGPYEKLGAILEQEHIDEVIVALEAHEMQFMPEIIYQTEKQGVKLSIIPTYNDFIPSRPTVDLVEDVKLIRLRTSPFDNPLNVAIKRLFDICASAFLLILVSPILLFVAVGIKITSPGPILFKQERVGLNKKPFTMLKFRSMKVNSTQDTGWSKDVDDRKTKFGAFIRKTSLDELPQFINVLRGDMSMIGPRPEVPFHVDHFKEEIPKYLLRQQVRPGISGWAQVNGLRGDTSIEERIKYDIWYIENWSLALDAYIVFKTVFGGMVNSEKLTNK